MKTTNYLNHMDAVNISAGIFFSKKAKRINEAMVVFTIAGAIIALIIAVVAY